MAASKARLLVTDRAGAAVLAAAARSLPGPPPQVYSRNNHSFDGNLTKIAPQLLVVDAEAEQCGPDELSLAGLCGLAKPGTSLPSPGLGTQDFMLPFSSGTTGKPKGEKVIIYLRGFVLYSVFNIKAFDCPTRT